MMRRVLFVGRARYRFPLDQAQRRKWDALAETIDFRVLASGVRGSGPPDPRFSLAAPLPSKALDGPAFYAGLPARVARELRRFDAEAIICQSPYEATGTYVGRRLARSHAATIVEVHGDWRTATELYGSRARLLLGPVAGRAAVEAIRRADAVRTLSAFTTSLVREIGVEPASVFPTWTDLGVFVERPALPLPDEPRVLFIGVLQPYKNIDAVVDVWRRVAPRVPGAVLQIVGKGPQSALVEGLLADLPAQTEWTPQLPAPEIAAALDRSTVFFLPSRAEGLGRVNIEALVRGRPVVAAGVGGIPDIVKRDVNGFLFAPDDHAGMAEALVAILTDRALAERLSDAAVPSVADWLWTPEDFAARVAELVERALAAR